MLGDGRLDRSDTDTIVAALVRENGAQRFPSDEDMKKPVLQDDAYHKRVVGFWLRRMENHGSKEKSLLDRTTIEHVMPQNAEVPAEWRKELGPDWERIHHELLHVIGNLTLTGYNSEYRDRSFKVKRDMENGFALSKLRLNIKIGRRERWDEAAILERGQTILADTIRIWPRSPVGARAAANASGPVLHVFAGPAERLLAALAAELHALAPGFEKEALSDSVVFSDGAIFARLRAVGEEVMVSLPMDATTLEDARRMASHGLSEDGGPSADVLLSVMEDVPYVARLAFQSYRACLSDT